MTKIGIVGLGLIGGSIEKKLTELGKYEILTSTNDETSKHQLKDLATCDIIFLCTPQSAIIQTLREIAFINSKSSDEGKIPYEQRAFANTLITDVGSSKMRICNKAKDFGLYNFVGSHPMAGTEKQGYEASFPELFQDCTWALMDHEGQFDSLPNAKLISDKVLLLERLIKELGSKSILKIDPLAHDKAVAAVSHLPLLLSLSLVNLAESTPHAKELMGPGFKSMTRLANGNIQLSEEIIHYNRSQIKEIWLQYKPFLENMLENQGDALNQELAAIKEKAPLAILNPSAF